MAPKRPPPHPIPVPDESVELDVQHDNQELQESSEGEDDGNGGLRAVVLHHLVTALLLVMIVAIGTWAYLTFKDSSFLAEPSEAERTVLHPFAIDAQRDRIAFAVEIYHRLYGKYPTTTRELVDEGLLRPSDLSYPAGEDVYDYELRGSEYRLTVNHPEPEHGSTSGSTSESEEPDAEAEGRAAEESDTDTGEPTPSE